MQHLVDAVRQSIRDQNWYAALTLALTLPDICSKLEQPSLGTDKRYPAWWDEWVGPGYREAIGPFWMPQEDLVLLSGQDAYALRCKVLHEGRDEILGARAQRVLERFRFVTSPDDPGPHKMGRDQLLMLHVGHYSEDVAAAAEQWRASKVGDAEIEEREAQMMKIIELPPGPFRSGDGNPLGL